jgi:hypothetical protein
MWLLTTCPHSYRLHQGVGPPYRTISSSGHKVQCYRTLVAKPIVVLGSSLRQPQCPCNCRYYGHTRWRGQLVPTGDNQCALTVRHEPCLLEAQRTRLMKLNVIW